MNKHWKIIAPLLLLLISGAIFVVYKQDLLGSHTSIQKISDTSDGSMQSYLQQAQQLSTSNQSATTTVTFLAVGDIMLSRDIAVEIQKSGSADSPFLGMADVLRGTDFNFANLEGPVAPTVKDEVIGGNSLTFGDASSSLQGLKDFNFQIINLANNHAWDQGLGGIDATIKTLDKLGIAHEGTGDNLDQAWTPAIVAANGIKICFVGAAYGTNTGGSEAAQYVAEIADVTHLKSAIATAKSECDFVVATMHAGTEYTRTPNQQQITFAHTAIDDGADIVIGAHPHWVQPIEKYCPSASPPLPPGEDVPMQRGTGEGADNCSNPKYIFYSLGNFIFDQDFSQDTMQGLTLKITISKNSSQNPLAPGAATSDDLQGQRQFATLDSIQLLPVIIQNSQARPATADEEKNILNKIGQTENTLK
jgi:poly-gamma-glutamate synthesis protein (capsule biosynthesis protein)